MQFEFFATWIDADAPCRRLSFLDRDDDTSDHYFIMDRSEDSPEEAIDDMANVYIERDDQCWGGYGGIERVVLTRNGLTLELNERMKLQMGDFAVIRITFEPSETQIREIRNVLGLIMRGYESRLVISD
jgi:hypothetical protein